MAQDLTLGTLTLGTATLGQIHALQGQDLALGTITMESPLVGSDATLTSQDLTLGTPALETPTLGQVHALATQALTLGTISLGSPWPYAATVIAFTNSLTPGATYRLYDSEIDEPTNLGAVADTLAAGTPGELREWVLPALSAPGAGVRRIVIVAVLGGVEDGYRRELAIEYDASGNAIFPRPNIPGMLESSISGLTLTVKYVYDSADEDAAGSILQLFLVAEGGTVDWTQPDGLASIAATGTLRTGTVQATASSDGWFRWAIRAATAPGAVANVYGDAASQLSDWSWTGAALTNTNYGLLYWTLSDVGGTRTVSIYKDAAKTSLVAQGSRVGDGPITLAAQSGSGLSGSVTVAYTAGDADAANIIHVNWQSSNTDLAGPLYLCDDVPAVPANVEVTVVA